MLDGSEHPSSQIQVGKAASSVHNAQAMTFTHEAISKRAREIWEREGRPEGRDKEHWLQAETELRQQATRSSHTVGATQAAIKSPVSPESKEDAGRRRPMQRGR